MDRVITGDETLESPESDDKCNSDPELVVPILALAVVMKTEMTSLSEVTSEDFSVSIVLFHIGSEVILDFKFMSLRSVVSLCTGMLRDTDVAVEER